MEFNDEFRLNLLLYRKPLSQLSTVIYNKVVRAHLFILSAVFILLRFTTKGFIPCILW
jgi:hypothetical protein